MDGKNPKKYDMSKVQSMERKSFFDSPALKLIGLCIVILIILGVLYVITLCFNKDALATGILDIIKVLVGAIIGGIVGNTASRYYGNP